MNPFELSWLPSITESFSVLISAIDNQVHDAGESIQNLARSRLDVNQLSSLGKMIKSHQQNGVNLHPLQPLTLGIVSNSNVEIFEDSLISSAARYGISLKVNITSLGQGFQQGFEANSFINTAKPDLVLIIFDYRAFYLFDNSATPGLIISAEEVSNQLLQLAKAFRNNSNATVILSTFACPPEITFGSFDSRQEGTLHHTIKGINANLVSCLDKGDLILDIDFLASCVGRLNWFDQRQWNHAKLPFTLKCLPLFGDYLARLLAAYMGKAKKCLVLDFDNTLWGGVIGDDGIEGVVLGNGSPLGEAFLDFQRFILSLKNRGIILAGCSKNDEDVAKEMFRSHPECLLKEEDFAVFVANWDDKPKNLRRIAEQLNIGLDALVFFDDNPYERNIVRKFLPQVVVVEVPSDPSQYRSVLSQSGWFEAISYSNDDRIRNEQYRANNRRMELASTSGIDVYLQSLGMKLFAEPFNQINRQRVTQLINKTNQFNLTTCRYNEHQIKAFEEDSFGYHYAFRLTDIYGDNGIIGVIICNQTDSKCWTVDTFLMSCRVLNRQVECAMLDHLVGCAIRNGVEIIKGIYIPSGRNGMVENLYENLKFRTIPSGNFNEEKIATLSVKEYKNSDFNIEIIEI